MVCEKYRRLIINIDLYHLNMNIHINTHMNIHVYICKYTCTYIVYVWKMMPSGSFLSGVITLSQCLITSLDCRLNLRIPRFHWSLSQSYNA